MEHRDDDRARICYIVAPDNQTGGGMGRVKDYILQGASNYDTAVKFLPLITRDQRGTLASLFLLANALWSIVLARFRGRLALVHVHFGDRGSAVRKGMIVIATRLVGGNAILHLHAVSFDRHYRAAGPLMRLIMRAPFVMASCNIVLGDRWRIWLVSDLGIPGERVAVLHNGVPAIAAGTQRRAGAASPKNILFLGNLMERKGVSDLIAAVALISPTIDFHLTFAGGGDIAVYQRMVAERGLSKSISFTGWIDQASATRMLEEADLLALPSYEEGLPLVILEALRSGTPVLCTPVGAIPEALTHRETAFFCPPGDPEALASALDTLLRDPELLALLSRRGMDAYAKCFTLDVFMRRLFDIYLKHCHVRVVEDDQIYLNNADHGR